MVQTKVKRSGKSGSRGSPRKSGSTTGRSRITSARSNGAPSRARRASKSSASRANRATKNSAPITGLTRYLGGSVRNKWMKGRGRAVASKAKGVVASGGKGLGAVGRAASRAKGVATVGAAGLAGLAGGIALDRWNNSYSRTQAFARSRRGRR